MGDNLDEIRQEILKREAELEALKKKLGINNRVDTNTETNPTTIVNSYKSDHDPTVYNDSYQALLHFINNNLDCHRCELSPIMFPVFVHIYLQLVCNNHLVLARSFFQKYSGSQEDYHHKDLSHLSIITTPDQVFNNHLVEIYRSNKYTVRLNKDSQCRLKRFLNDLKLPALSSIISEHIIIDVFEGAMRSKENIDATAGALLGDIRKEVNKTRMYYGLLCMEGDVEVRVDDDDEDAPKRKKQRKDIVVKKGKMDVNSPALNRIVLPELRFSDRVERAMAIRESSKKVMIGKDNLPSICFYSLLNSAHSVSSLEISEDSSMMASGFSNSTIKVWSLGKQLLKMKDAQQLELLDREAGDINEQLMDAKSGEESRLLCGHSGPVYSTSFSPDRTQLISASEDGTVRLWSLLTWSNLVNYKGHLYPVWDAKFSPLGHYFASCGHDSTVRLWCTDQYQPLRIFVGHLSDATCVEFHPNCNYLASGSEDRTIRIWDVLNGMCVRILSGHKDTIDVLKFSPCGRYLSSAGRDKEVVVWDLATGEMLAHLQGHLRPIKALCFSRDGNVLASGGMDGMVKLWDAKGLRAGKKNVFSGQSDSTSSRGAQLASYSTKYSPITHLHFTRKNLLLASGPYLPTHLC